MSSSKPERPAPFHEVIGRRLAQSARGVASIGADAKRAETLFVLSLIDEIEVPPKTVEDLARECDNVASAIQQSVEKNRVLLGGIGRRDALNVATAVTKTAAKLRQRLESTTTEQSGPRRSLGTGNCRVMHQAMQATDEDDG